MQKRPLVLVSLLTASLWSCRNDNADDQLAWSCANTKVRPYAKASPECMKEIEANPGDILKFYKPVANLVAGRVESYTLYPADDRRPAKK